MDKTKGVVVAVAAVWGLAGCGQTPGDAEVREALHSKVVAFYGKSQERNEQSLKAELANVKVIGCKKSEPNGFNCDWTGGGGFGNTGRIVKSDSGWVLVGAGG